jgi:hypothetical protein
VGSKRVTRTVYFGHVHVETTYAPHDGGRTWATSDATPERPGKLVRMASSAPRTLADQLRGWSDEQLAHLLTRRPDLAVPAPQDSSQLASRLGTRASVLRAVDQLSRLELTVLEAVVALGGTTSADRLEAVVNAAPAAVADAVGTVRGLGLLWGTDDSLRVVQVLRDVLGTRTSRLAPSVATLLAGQGPSRVNALARRLGLGPSGDRHTDVNAIAALLGDDTEVERLVGEVDDRARAILDHLDREGRDGVVETTERSTSHGPARGPVDQLLERGLLVARDRKHVAVPAEVSICLRGGTTRERADLPPELATSTRDQALVDRAAAGAAFDLVRRVELLLEHWGTAPPSALRAGGLAVRDLKAAAVLLHMDEPTAALHVEIAAAADLIAPGTTPDGESVWLPTDAFDAWTATSPANRWTRLAAAWLESPRLTGLVGGREDPAEQQSAGHRGKQVNALLPGLERAWLPETRRAALDQLGGLGHGTVLAAGTGVPSLVARMDWLRPGRPPARGQAVAWAVEESAVVGVTGLGGLSRHGRALLGDDPAAVAALEPLLPSTVDHVLVQADLTAVAPGPLEPDLGRRLAAVADVESRGGATVYRFTESSVRRAFDSGWSAGDVHDFVASASRTPVPQALSYLVDDVSRRFGTVRVGVAEAFLRSDDEAALAVLVHDPRNASLGLRRIAPTVVVSGVPAEVLVERLRASGVAPVVEAADGTVRVARPQLLRARTPRRGGPDPSAGTAADPRTASRLAARAASTVTAIRAGDRAARSRPDGLRAAEPTTPASTLAALREAVEAAQSVWIGYVDSHGSTVERVVDPVGLDAGLLSAYDHRSEDVRTFAVHRITAVRRLS